MCRYDCGSNPASCDVQNIAFLPFSLSKSFLERTLIFTDIEKFYLLKYISFSLKCKMTTVGMFLIWKIYRVE